MHRGGPARCEAKGSESVAISVDLLAARSQPREARGRAGRRRCARRRHHLLAPISAASACWSARMPACSTPPWPSWRATPSRAFEKAMRRVRHRRAAVSSPRTTAPWRRPAEARRLPVYSFASGRHQLHARRRLSLRPRRRHGDRCRRHHDRRRASSSHGFPREANSVVEVGGVRTLFRMPDLLSIGLGGGSHVVPLDPLKVGPAVVGYRLTEGGARVRRRQLTATDVAVATGAPRARRPRRKVAACSTPRPAEEVLAAGRAHGRGGDRPHEDRGGRRAADRGRRRRLPDAGEAAGRVPGDPCRSTASAPTPWARPSPRSRARCDQIFQDMTRDRRDRRRPGHRQRPRRRRRRRRARRSAPSRARTCRWPTCPATRCACACAWWATSRRPDTVRATSERERAMKRSIVVSPWLLPPGVVRLRPAHGPEPAAQSVGVELQLREGQATAPCRR